MTDSGTILCGKYGAYVLPMLVRVESDIVADMQKLVGGIPDGVDCCNTSHDHDRDKYKRRPALQWLTRWFRYAAVTLPYCLTKQFGLLITLFTQCRFPA